MKILRQRPLFLVSLLDNLDRDIIQPRIPQTLLVQQKHADYKTKRICFYPSIDSALTAFSTTLEGVTLFVYQPVGLHTDSLVKPSITSVPTSPITDEYWYLAPIQLKKVAQIKVIKSLGTLDYTHGPKSTKDHLYKWKWEEVLQPWEKKKNFSALLDKFEKGKKKKYKSPERDRQNADPEFVENLHKELSTATTAKERKSIFERHINDPFGLSVNIAYTIRLQRSESQNKTKH